ncbi:MAG: hypothetical protein ABI446_01810 [Gemmatimonadaceae bacterium]
MKSIPRFRPSQALPLLLLLALPEGCKKKASSETPQQAAAPAAPAAQSAASAVSSAAPDTTESAPSWLAHPTISAGTTVLSALDPHAMSPTEVQFGVAPKLSKDVEYQPNVIVMEQGDKAIKSIASDGLNITFDAKAPHVSEFEVGKIVFATGRAVGMVNVLRKEGSTVTAILTPVPLEALIKNGRFVMDEDVDPNKMISYVAPDYPGVNDTTGMYTTSMGGPAADHRSTIAVSLPQRGEWVPTAMTSLDHGRRASSRSPHLPRWARRNFAAADAELAALRRRQVGMPQGVPRVPTLPPLNIPPTLTTGPPPQVNVGNGDVRIENVANNSYVGVQYYYVKQGMGATAAGFVSLHRPRIRCVLTFTNGHQNVDSAGLEIKGAAGIRLRLDGHSAVDKVINLHLSQFVPINISIPLGGPVPLSLTFATFFNINTAFSAKASITVAEGEYTFEGGVWAGRAGGQWQVATPAKFTAVKSLGSSVAGLSLGINSFTLGFGIRTMVGVGAFGFNVGVFATVRFGGGILIGPNEAYACKRASLDGFIDTGVGYQLPKVFSVVLNFFITSAGGKAIDAVGTIGKGPSMNLFSEDVSVPTGCASPKPG